MPPTSRGLTVLRNVRQNNLSTRTTSARIFSCHPTIPKLQPITFVQQSRLISTRLDRPGAQRHSRLPSAKQDRTRDGKQDDNKKRQQEQQQEQQQDSSPFQEPSRYYRYRDWLLKFVGMCPILYLIIIHTPYDQLPVTGYSMSPTFNDRYGLNSPFDLTDPDPDPESPLALSNRDWVIVQNWRLSDYVPDPNERSIRRREGAYIWQNFLSGFERGQVVVYGSPHNPDKMSVKRIVGLPGDRVQPRPLYHKSRDENGREIIVTEEFDPVVVPWNHLWVEGDNPLRSQSCDSNFYGPISQNLIEALVVAVMPHAWSFHRMRRLDWEGQSYPALEEGRVEENAVAEAGVSPDAAERTRAWKDGTIERMLIALRAEPGLMIEKFVESENMKKAVRDLYRMARFTASVGQMGREASGDDDDDYDGNKGAEAVTVLAQEIIEEMELVYGKEQLMVRKKKQNRADMDETNKSMKSDDIRTGTNIQAALAGEKRLRGQGWEMERDQQGKIVTKTS